jgi:tetratricopeptide (TPR) repeat protein
VNDVDPSSENDVFVGRERELAVLTAALHDAIAGRGHLVLVSGEPGIGKSRLADELATRARGMDVSVLWGRCWEAGGAPAYWPWVQSLRSYARDLDVETLRSQLGRGGADLAELVPDVRDVVPGPSAPASVDPETARFRLFNAVADFLLNAGKAHPLMLVLDDLHAADTPSLLLLQFLATEVSNARLLLVGTYRDVDPTIRDPLSSALAELTRLPVTRMLPLSGLDRPEVATFIGRSAGVDPDERLVTGMYEETEGNPLFLSEVVRLLVSEAKLANVALAPFPRLSIPHGIRAVIDHRLGSLSEESRSVLTLAAVLGREFGLDALALVGGLAPSAILELLEDAIAERVVTTAAPGRVRFSHALIRDVLYDELPPARRIRLHREIGEALERVYDEHEPHLTELAHHFIAAAPAGDVEKAIDYAERAGVRAARLLAYEEAVRLFQTALEALELQEPVDNAAYCELLLELGDAQARAGDVAAAKKTFLEAAEIAKRESMPKRLARAALGYGGRFVWEPGRGDPHLRPLLEEALAVLPGGDDELRVRVMTRLAGGPLADVHAAERRRDALSLEAVETSRRLEDPATLAYALDGRWTAIWGPDTLDERRTVARGVVDSARAAGDKELLHDGHIWCALAGLESGDMSVVDSELEAQARLATELRQPAQLWFGVVLRATLATFEGRFAHAEELIPQAATLARAAGLIADVYRTVQLWALRREQGRLDEVESALTDAIHRYRMYDVLRSIGVHAAMELGREHDASEGLEALTADGFAALARNDDWIFDLCLLTDVCQAVGDAACADQIYERLIPYADRNAVNPPAACVGAAARSIGVLAAMAERWEEAEHHFEHALAMNSRMGARPWVARTTFDWAEMVLRRAGPGDRDRAAKLLARAQVIGSELGLGALERRIASLAERTAGRAPEHTRALQARRTSFRRDGEYWSIDYEEDSFRLKDSRGLHYLARLLDEPGRELHALDLVAGVRGGEPVVHGAEPGIASSPHGDTGEILDARAKAEYRRRLSELEEELEEARTFSDPERAARAEEEHDFLVRELAGAIGLGGRDRRAGSPSERARVSVTRAIRSALGRIREHSSALGDHLESTIRTGTYCSYTPDPRSPIDWHI